MWGKYFFSAVIGAAAIELISIKSLGGAWSNFSAASSIAFLSGAIPLFFLGFTGTIGTPNSLSNPGISICVPLRPANPSW